LDSAAVAPGAVGVDTNRKTVQHLEGGIVARLAVRDYDVVKAGQELIRLDDTQAKAALALVKGRLVAANALAARLRAERDGAERIEFAPYLLAQRDDPEVAQTLRGQLNIFEARRRSIAGQRAILERQIAAVEEEIAGLKEQVEAQAREIKLLEEEIKDTDELYQKGLAKKSRMLALQRGLAEIQGSRAQNRATIARGGERIAEARLKISELETALINEAVKDLRDTEAQIFDLTERQRAAEDVLARTSIRAPMDGTVVGLRAHTHGGVIGPGAPILDIVPSGERLVIEARIDPNDIDVVQPGLPAQVRLTPFNARGTAPLAGRVAAVSADRLADERTGVPYYLARVDFVDDPAKALDGAALTPGMPAEVMIATGARTALDYFLRPITRSFNRAFREQ
jgi:HlyD family type I secretion membrane fusion protein